MDPSLLVDGVIRQTVVLVARLVRATGHRPPLAELGTRIFVELNDELRRQGVRASLLAGLFGLKLRTYHDRLLRAREALDGLEPPLFSSIYAIIRDEGPVERWVIEGRFVDEHHKVLGAVLDDLVESGLVYRTGRGPATRYGLVGAAGQDGEARAAAEARLVWVALYHRSPASRAELSAVLGEEGDLDGALGRLLAAGRIERVGEGRETRWRCADYAIGMGDRAGWPAAMFDHFQAVVTTLCAKLDGAGAAASDEVGGSTYVFEVGPGHPDEAEVRALLADTRRRLDALRARVLAHNRERPASGGRVVFYFGQHRR